MNRIVQVIEGREKGPLIILLASIHGNEPSGILAMKSIFKTLEQNNSQIRGKIIGILGNIQAIREKERFLDYDLNRCWTEEKIKRIQINGRSMHYREDREMRELHELFGSLEKADNFVQKICIDLHTTSADNGTFIIVGESSACDPVFQQLNLPVVMDFEKYISGSVMDYLQRKGILCFSFEGGKIGSKEAVTTHIGGIWKVLLSTGAMDETSLKDYGFKNNNSKVFSDFNSRFLRVKYRHPITRDDHFRMNPGYGNFRQINRGEILGTDRNGAVRSPLDGYVFMPLYQNSGSDGFFVVQEAF